MNISFKGGSSAQQSLITQAHQLAETLATNAKSNINTSADYSTWFGSGTKSSVESTYQNVIDALNNLSFEYNVESMTMDQIGNELFFCYGKDSTETNKTVITWIGMFSQSSLDVVKKAAISIIDMVATTDSIYDTEIASDQDGSKFIAEYDASTAVITPRNYMYFAELFA
jgi:hypothetical protein